MHGTRFFAAFAIFCSSLLFPLGLFAADNPAWWFSRGTVVTNAAARDNAAVNAGQVKWFSTNAYDELQEHLPNGAGTNVAALVAGFSLTNNDVAVNIGQLKSVGTPFYDRLNTEGYYTNSYYPWTSTATDDVDNAMANIGQLKTVFNFDLTVDLGGNGLPDWWEYYWLGTTNETVFMDSDHDGTNNLAEYQQGTDPRGAMWVEAAGKGEATACWYAPRATGIVAYAYEVFTNDVSQGSSSFGPESATQVTIADLQDQTEYRVTVTGTNSGGGLVWSNSVQWLQPGSDLVFWPLFAAIPSQTVSSASCVVQTRTLQVDCIGQFDRFYVSSSSRGPGGWLQTGTRLEMAIGSGTNEVLCAYGYEIPGSNTSLDVTGDFRIPDGTNTLRFEIRYDGSGQVGIGKALYFLKWRPTINGTS